MDKDGNKLTAKEVMELVYELAQNTKAKLDAIQAKLAELDANDPASKQAGYIYAGALTLGAGIQEDICDLGEAVEAVIRAEDYFDEHGALSPSSTLDGVPATDIGTLLPIDGAPATDELKFDEPVLTPAENEEFIAMLSQIFGVDPDKLRQ